jgi:hypothetical protein
LEKVDGIDGLFASGMEDARENGESPGAVQRSISEADFSEDDTWAQGSFRMIVGGIDLGRLHKGEPTKFFFNEAFTKGFCGMEI